MNTRRYNFLFLTFFFLLSEFLLFITVIIVLYNVETDEIKTLEGHYFGDELLTGYDNSWVSKRRE